MGDMDDNQALRREIRRKPGTWGFVTAAGLALVLAFVLGDVLSPWTPKARSENFDRAFLTCLDVNDAEFPDGLYREDLGRHYDAEGLCFLDAAYHGGSAFEENWLDPAYVERMRNQPAD